MKHHPFFAKVLEGGKRIAYGARALNEGGFQSIPKVAFPGGALVGDTAGFLNVPKIKGIHSSMKSGMLAAESTFKALSNSTDDGVVMLYNYEESLRDSSIWKELNMIRNMRPSFHNPLGLFGGILYSGLEAYVLRASGVVTRRLLVSGSLCNFLGAMSILFGERGRGRCHRARSWVLPHRGGTADRTRTRTKQCTAIV